MAISHALIILGEVAVAAFVIWGFLHEDRFIAFENQIVAKLKNRKRK